MLNFLSWLGKLVLIVVGGSLVFGLVVFLALKFPLFKLFFVIAVAIALLVFFTLSNQRRAANKSDGQSNAGSTS